MSMFKSFANATVTSLDTFATTVQRVGQMVDDLGAAGADQTKRLRSASRDSLLRTEAQSRAERANLTQWEEQEKTRILLNNHVEEQKLKALQEQLGISDEQLAAERKALDEKIAKLK